MDAPEVIEKIGVRLLVIAAVNASQHNGAEADLQTRKKADCLTLAAAEIGRLAKCESRYLLGFVAGETILLPVEPFYCR